MIADVLPERPPDRPTAWWAARLDCLPRWETLAWGLVALAAVLTRLVDIASPPLSPDEGRRALEGFTLFREWRVAYEAGPLLPNILSIVFALFTPGDGQARLPSAIVGTLLVGQSWLLRPVLGSRWSLGVAAALALSPPLIVLSRTVSPAIFSLCCLLLTVACAWRFGHARDARWLVGAFVAVALGLASDPSFAVGLAGLLLSYAIAEGDLGVRGPWFPSIRASAGRAALVAVTVGVLASTRLLTSLNGVQAGLIDPLWAWSADMVRGSGFQAPLFLALLDGGTLLLALVGAASFRRHRRAVRFLGTWLLVSITLAALMRQPDVRYLFQPSLPAALLAGLGLVSIGETLRSAGTTRAILVGLAAFVPLVTATFQVNVGLRQGADPWGAAAVVAGAGIVLVGLLAFNLLTMAEARAALGTIALVVVLVGTVSGTSRWLGARGSDRGHLVETSVLTDEIRRVREDAQRWYRADPSAPISVDPALRPLVAWSLRDVPTVRYDATAPTAGQPRILAGPPSEADPAVPTERLIVGYADERETLSVRLARLWPWLAQRQSLVGVRPYAIVLVQPVSK